MTEQTEEDGTAINHTLWTIVKYVRMHFNLNNRVIQVEKHYKITTSLKEELFPDWYACIL
jgi:hypothetical protein